MWLLVIIFFGWVFWEILKTQSEKKKNDDWKKSHGIDDIPTHPWCEMENKSIDSIVGTFEKVEKSPLGGIDYYFRLTHEHESYIQEKSFGNFKEVKYIWGIGDRVKLWVPDKHRNDIKPTNLIGMMNKVAIGTEVIVEYIGERLRINDKTPSKRYDVFRVHKHSQTKNKWIKIK